MSTSKENFLKTIYNYQQNEILKAKPSTIAKSLGITNAAGTDMSRKLAGHNLVNYIKYRELSLTDEGQRLALNIIRKHRLWETFLFKILGLSLYEIHREADLLEHQTSDFLADKISNYLGNPTWDPHGDPIPDAGGVMASNKMHILLSKATPSEYYEIIRLSGNDHEFFTFCKDNYLLVGTRIEVVRQYTNNRMTEIRVIGSKMLLNQEISNQIYLKNISPNN